jgi:hypothetical protein
VWQYASSASHADLRFGPVLGNLVSTLWSADQPSDFPIPNGWAEVKNDMAVRIGSSI